MGDLATDRPVLVTGASGFIASHVIQILLARGYYVRGTHRPSSIASIEHLLQLPNADSHLSFIEADLTEREAWKVACEGGVEYVIHIASPHILKPIDPLSALIDPAVKGTQYVLEMCQATTSVKKLVITSCMCAVSDSFDDMDSARTGGRTEYDERDWNNKSSVNRNSYAYSKTMAERMAHDFVQKADCSFKLVTILPFMVWGPPLANRLAFSHRFLLGFIDKNKLGDAPSYLITLHYFEFNYRSVAFTAVLNLNICISDVRDVAAAHVLAIENESVQGRYCLCHPPKALSTILQMVHEAYPDIELPTRNVRDFFVMAYMSRDKTWRKEYLVHNLGKMPQINCSRAAAAGMQLRPPIQTIMDTIRTLREKALMDVPPEHPACVPEGGSSEPAGSCIVN